MYIKKFLRFTFPVILSVFISCSESPTDIGVRILDGDLIGIAELNSLTDSVSQTSSSIKEVVQLGISEKLFVGKNHNVEASTLMNFRMVTPDTALLRDFREDSISILSSTVQLLNIYEIGDTNAALNFNVHKITNGWSSLTFTVDSLEKLQYDGTNIGNNIIVTDSISTFELDNSVVLSWIKDNEDSTINNDYGIFLEPTTNSRIVGFQANSINADTAEVPQMFVIYDKAGVIDTAKFYCFEDVSTVKGEIPDGGSETIYVQGGLTSSAKLWFDLSGIPENSVINHAQLILTLDTLQTVVGNNYINALRASMLLDSSRTDSLSSGFSLTRDGNKFSGDIRSIVQAMYTLQQNYGLLIAPVSRTDGLELFAIKSSTAADPALRPYLKIIYVNKK